MLEMPRSKKRRLILFILILFILILALLSSGCGMRAAGAQDAAGLVQAKPGMATEAPASAPSKVIELNVFAAASLTEPFSEIGKRFESEHPGVNVVFNFAGSQQLAQQINQGAPADVFASANKTQLDVVIQAGGIITGTQQAFVKNRLTIIYPQDNPAGVKELGDLAKPGLKLVLATKEVPVGQYALSYLDKATADPSLGSGYKDAVLKNVVSYENDVKSVLAKVALGEADAGIVYTSDISGADADKVGRLDIPYSLNVIASYPIAPLKESKQPDLAKTFIDFVLSPGGQNILAKYNFIPEK